MPKKDENKKKVSKFFMPWNFEKEQKWLEEKAREGWLLEKTFFNYHFVKSEPKEMIYRVDYFSISNEKKLKEYRAIYEESGWEFVHSSIGWNYFRIPADEFTTDIYSDTPSRIEHLKRINQDAIGFFFLYFILFAVVMDYETWFDLIIFIPMAALMVWGAVYMIKIREKIKLLNDTLEEEDRINTDL